MSLNESIIEGGAFGWFTELGIVTTEERASR
jgi:hypothetical protein